MDLLVPSFGLIIWTLVVFLIVFLLMKKFAWKPILSSLKERETTISDSIAAAERVKAEMTQLKNENEAMLAKAREERTQMLKEARDTKDRIINEAKEQAKIEANKIILDAQAAIQQQKMAAITDVKNQVGNLVIEVSRKVIGQQLENSAAQDALVKQMIEEVKLN
jgi:F-type H+-transporting ATPase subunit b